MTLRWLLIFKVGLLLACGDRAPGALPRPRTIGLGPGAACISDADCPATQWCLHNRCSDRPTPAPPLTPVAGQWTASPEVLNFGNVSPGSRRRLAVVLSNVGQTILTLDDWRVLPEGTAFSVDTLGYGPFWIRPGRSRDIFVTFAPEQPGHVDATLVLEAAAPDLAVPLIGN